ncbi:hypothetical protein [Gemmatimonas sp.]|uniref:hypothetical protein n=1 Tax=Gemmatimonas sp. TaxID=1962908 RepID=UPI0022CC8B07|nr:hypothetical protein [Gemmatimonas sp.]MCZ8206527.1 hypothetical protein [Gemmatimonas sp.]
MEEAPEAHQRIALTKQGLVEEVLLRRDTLGLNGAINFVCDEFVGLDDEPVSPTSLRRWVEQYDAHGLAGLLRQQRTDRGLRRSLDALAARHRLNADALERFMHNTLITGRGSAAVLFEALTETWSRVPWNQKTVQRWARLWKAENPHLLKMVQEGEGRFLDHCALYLGWSEIAPLAWALLDSTQLDKRVTLPPGHPQEGAVVRPWVSLMLDLGSRAAVTFEITLTPPTPATMKSLLRRAWCAGENWQGLPTVPLPQHVRVDAGSEHKGAFQEALAAFGLDKRVPKGMPERQAHIERAVKTVFGDAVRGRPGWTAVERVADETDTSTREHARSKNAEREARRNETPKKNLMTLTECTERIRQIVLRYNAQLHSGLAQEYRDRVAASQVA